MGRRQDTRGQKDIPAAQLRAMPAVPFKNPNNYVQVWPNAWARSSGVPSLQGVKAGATAGEPGGRDE